MKVVKGGIECQRVLHRIGMIGQCFEKKSSEGSGTDQGAEYLIGDCFVLLPKGLDTGKASKRLATIGWYFRFSGSRVAGAIKELPLALVVGTHPALPSSRNAARSISVFHRKITFIAQVVLEWEELFFQEGVLEERATKRRSSIRDAASLAKGLPSPEEADPNEQAKLQSGGAIRRNGCTSAMAGEAKAAPVLVLSLAEKRFIREQGIPFVVARYLRSKARNWTTRLQLLNEEESLVGEGALSNSEATKPFFSSPRFPTSNRERGYFRISRYRIKPCKSQPKEILQQSQGNKMPNPGKLGAKAYQFPSKGNKGGHQTNSSLNGNSLRMPQDRISKSTSDWIPRGWTNQLLWGTKDEIQSIPPFKWFSLLLVPVPNSSPGSSQCLALSILRTCNCDPFARTEGLSVETSTNNRRFLIVFPLLTAALFTPPDIWCQIVARFLISLIIELAIFVASIVQVREEVWTSGMRGSGSIDKKEKEPP
uniref:Uncharacterized protein n=1 Tax=Salix viminalis TaxID=40686 RepID=A0A6N2NG10_SALVM